MTPKRPNAKQKNILLIALVFRYITTDNLARHKNITHNSAYSALEILYKNGYLGKLHNKTYRLQNKSARYYVTKQAIEYIRKETNVELDEVVWNSRRRAESKSQDFIDLQVAIHAAYITLKKKLGKDTTIYTQLDLRDIEGIIKPLPSLMVETETDERYFIELTDGQHLFLTKKRIRKYIQNHEDNEWEWEKYPDVYIIRNSAPDRMRLRKYAEEKMDDAYLDEDDFSFCIVGSIERVNI